MRDRGKKDLLEEKRRSMRREKDFQMRDCKRSVILARADN